MPASFWENPATPVYPRRFWRIPGLTAADSEAIHASLKAAGWLDAQDYFIGDARASGAGTWTETTPPAYGGLSLREPLRDQLLVCAAKHHFFGDVNSRTLRFWLEQLP